MQNNEVLDRIKNNIYIMKYEELLVFQICNVTM